jgi:antirestriction protein ArdC
MTQEIHNISFKNYLSEIYDNPSKLHEAYKIFHNYSFYNTILAKSQMSKLEPINTYVGWKKLDRQVKKGSKAIKLLLPIKYNKKSDNDNNQKHEEATTFTKFIKKPNWFSLSQTEGKAFKNPELPNFNILESLKNLGIKKEEFRIINGNCQGYAIPNENIIAINPLAFAPYKTIFHEIAHCLLHKDKSLMIDDIKLNNSIMEFEAETVAYLVCSSLGEFEHLEYSRGYVMNWINKDNIKEENFKRSFDAANKILKSSTIKGL